MKKLPALNSLGRTIKLRIDGRKDANGAVIREPVNWLPGLDGRRVRVRSAHAALNTLLQSAGALLMKRALVLMDEALQETLVPDVDYSLVGVIHDEFQLDVKPETR